MRATKGWMLTDDEYRTLARYGSAKVIEQADQQSVQKLAQMHLMELGCHETEEHDLQETVRLTAIGKRVLQREKILRSPVRRFFYKIHCAIS